MSTKLISITLPLSPDMLADVADLRASIEESLWKLDVAFVQARERRKELHDGPFPPKLRRRCRDWIDRRSHRSCRCVMRKADEVRYSPAGPLLAHYECRRGHRTGPIDAFYAEWLARA